MRKCMEEVRNLLLAKADCIWIKSIEEASVIHDIVELHEDPRFSTINLKLWSLTEGVSDISTTTLADNFIRREKIDAKLKNFNALFEEIRQKREGNSRNIWILRDLHALMKEPAMQRCLRDQMEYKGRAYNPIMVISPVSTLPDDIAHLFRIVDYSLPDKDLIQEELESFNEMIKTRANEVSPSNGKNYIASSDVEMKKLLRACMGLTQKELEMTSRESLVKYQHLNLDYLSNSKIEMVKKTDVLDYRIPKLCLSDIGGNEAIKDWLIEEGAAIEDDRAREFGIDLPKGFMAVGIPGTGKTAIAEAFAGELHVPLLSLSMSKIFNRLVGDSEKKIDRALQVAEACAPCVLLLDEVEKMLGGSQSSNQSDGGVTNRVLQSILKFMQDNNSGVYVIMTSNDVSQLPPEFTRSGRLDATWYFGIPSREERRGIFKIHFAKKKFPISDSMLDIAVDESRTFTGAEVEQAVKNIIRKAFTRYIQDGNKDLTEEDIAAGCKEVIPIAVSSKEKIAALEAYCKNRAHRTSKDTKEEVQKKEATFDFDF